MPKADALLKIGVGFIAFNMFYISPKHEFQKSSSALKVFFDLSVQVFSSS